MPPFNQIRDPSKQQPNPYILSTITVAVLDEEGQVQLRRLHELEQSCRLLHSCPARSRPAPTQYFCLGGAAGPGDAKKPGHLMHVLAPKPSARVHRLAEALCVDQIGDVSLSRDPDSCRRMPYQTIYEFCCGPSTAQKMS